MKITAVHYEGDTSSLVMGRHHDFRGTEGTAFNGGLIKPFFSHLHKLIAPLQATIK